MVNGIYFNVNRGGDDDSLYSSSSGFSSRRSDFPDEEGDRKKSYSSVYSRFRSWIRSPMPPEIIPYEDLSAISLDELNKLTGNFDHMSIVGKTKYTSVFCATLSTGEAAAVKDIYPRSIEGSDSYIAAKLAKVSTLKHQNLLGLLGYCLDLNKRILVYPFATMGSLHDIMHGRKGVKGSEPGPVLTWNQRVKIACGAAQALEYLHSVDIIHGAIKSSNILIFDDFVPKIADIYLSNESPYKNTVPWHAARATSPDPYFPPEHDSGTQATKKCDIYRFGVVLLELLTGRIADCLTLHGYGNREYMLLSWVVELAYRTPHEGPTKKAEAGLGGGMGLSQGGKSKIVGRSSRMDRSQTKY